MDIHANSVSLGSQYMDPDQPNPLFIPEIILLVFEYVDPSLYRRLSEVCRLWKSVGHSLAWSHCSMDNRHLFGLLQQDRVQHKAAIIGDTQDKEKESEKTMAGTKQEDNLAIDKTSFVMNFRLIKELKFSEKSDLTAAYLASFTPPDPTTVFRKGRIHPSTILRNCHRFRGLQTLVVRPSLAISQDQTVLLQAPELLIFQHSIEALHQLQSTVPPIVSGSTPPTPEFEFRSLFCPFLETLYLHNIQPVTTTQCRTPFFQLWSQEEPKTTLRLLTSLTILNFHTGCRVSGSGIEPANWEDYWSIDPLLAILRLCPSLTHLRVSYDITLASQPGPRGFKRMVRTLYPHHDDTEWSYVPDDFVSKFGLLVPCLNSIDFGMRPHFDHTAWQWLMLVYRGRLKALSLWNALGFDMLSLTYLIGPPLGHPNRLKQPLQLTKLDINGLHATAKSAWLVFQQIPTLLDFSARDVPLDATRLIGYDWVCTGLQRLEIYVAVPKEPAEEETTWTWDEENRAWKEVCGTFLGVADFDGQDLQQDYSTRPQIQVCEQLGQLTDLRKLTLEGGTDSNDDRDDGVMPPGYECMKLTLETGLDRLAPLKRRLETLVVYQLDEQLCRRKEMDWIARNWVHHNNLYWLQTHSLEAQPLMTSTSTLTTDEYCASTAASYLVPAPTFEALLGISVKSANTGERGVETRR
ncbi:hypothetical protein BGZ98_006624 [Dissophora globulifera]|nr:hypothetical protein BGZ98_006624 [Dissophora globulifera]